MATNIEIRRYSGNAWGTVYPKANWNNIDNKPATFTPSAHSHTPRSIGVAPIYRYGTQGTTTKIKININSTAYWMLCFTVTLYQSYRATKIMISGYNYGYGGQYWYQPEARILGDSDGNETITVYFGYDSARNLWVGFDGGDYTGVSINDITNGYDQLDHFDELFTISNVSSLSTIQTTITAGSKANYSNNSEKLNGQEASYYLNYNNLTNKPTIPDISGKADKASVTAGWYKRVYVNAQGIVTNGDQTDANDDTNTWRKVQLNGTDKLGNGINTNPLNIKAGDNMTITESNGTFTFAATDTNTWRPLGTGSTDACAGNDERLNNIKRLNWWTDNNGNDVDDLAYGTTFAYPTHNAPTAGTIVAFSHSGGTYQLQLQGKYYGKELYYRSKNGDNGNWNAWERLANASEIPDISGKLDKSAFSLNGTTLTLTL